MAALAILVGSFAARMWSLDARSLWWDEAFTWRAASLDLAGYWALQQAERHPPLYYFEARAWLALAGSSEFALRFPSVIAGTLLVAIAGWLARSWYGFGSGLLVMATVAVAPPLVGASQEARMYAQMATLAVLATGMTAALAAGRWRGGWRWAGLSAVLACLLLSHYFAAAYVAALGFATLVVAWRAWPRTRGWVRPWVLAQVGAVVPVTLWIVYQAAGGRLGTGPEPPLPLPEMVRQVFHFIASGQREVTDGVWGLPELAAASGLAAATIVAALSRRHLALLGLAVAAGAAVTVLAIVAVTVSFHPRYALPAAALGWIAAPGALAVLPRQDRLRRVVGLLAVLSLVAALGSGWITAVSRVRDNPRGLATAMAGAGLPGDVALVEHNDFTLSYYPPGPIRVAMIDAAEPEIAIAQIGAAAAAASRVWLVHWDEARQDPWGAWEWALERAGRPLTRLREPFYTATLYAVEEPVQSPVLAPVPGVPHDVLRLLQATPARARTAVTLAVEWGAQVRLRNPVAWLEVRDAANRVVAAVDRPLDFTPGDRARAFLTAPLPTGLPPQPLFVLGWATAEGVLAPPIELGQVTLPRLVEARPDAQRAAGVPAVAVPGLALAELRIDPPRAPPGGWVDASFLWVRTGSDAAYPAIAIRRGGAIIDYPVDDVLQEVFPIARWPPGVPVLDRRTFRFPPSTDPLELVLLDGTRGTPLALVELDRRGLRFEPPPRMQAIGVEFPGLGHLAGIVPTETAAAGGPFPIELVWRAGPMAATTSYTVFVHLVTADGQRIGQHDGIPAGGTRRTSTWVPGEYVLDRHEVAVTNRAYDGPARFFVGLYDAATGLRLRTADGRDVVELSLTVTVRP